MRFVTIILLLFSCVTTTIALCIDHKPIIDTAKKHSSLPHAGRAIPEDKLYYNDCVFVYKYTLSQRLKKYPWSKASKILIASHQGNEPNSEVSIDTLYRISKTDIPINKKNMIKDSLISGFHFYKDSLGYTKLIEVKQLTFKQIIHLTNIIYNNDVKVPNDYAVMGGKCFNPRNALIFFDKNGNEFDRIEICFECIGQESTSGRISIGIGCNQKFEMLRKYFIRLGIKYGTIEH